MTSYFTNKITYFYTAVNNAVKLRSVFGTKHRIWELDTLHFTNLLIFGHVKIEFLCESNNSKNLGNIGKNYNFCDIFKIDGFMSIMSWYRCRRVDVQWCATVG